MLATVDISDILNPFTVAIESRGEITAAGKMTMVGNKIYVSTSNGTGSYAATIGGISVFEVDGIVSANADLSMIRSNEIKVFKNAYVGESLEVGNSINVGQGGVYIDRGQGLAVDGPIKVRFSDPNMVLTSAPDPLTIIETKLEGITQSSPTGAPKIRLNRKWLDTVALADEILIDTTDLDSVDLQAVNCNRIRLSGTNDINGGWVTSQLIGATGVGESTTFHSDFVGHWQKFGIGGDTTTFDGWVLSNWVEIGPGVTANSSLWGYNFKFTGNNTAGDVYGVYVDYAGATAVNKAYGIWVRDADENILDGKLTINDHPHLYLNARDPNQFSGSNQFISGRYDEANSDYTFTRVGDVVTCTGKTIAGGNPTINIPLGTIAPNQAWGVASFNVGNTACKVGYKNATQVEIKKADDSAIGIGDGTQWFTFSYVIA